MARLAVLAPRYPQPRQTARIDRTVTLGQLNRANRAEAPTPRRPSWDWAGTYITMPTLPPPLAGCKIFPCLPGDKLPALNYGWQNRATNDNGQISQWEAGMADLNWGVACGPSGLFVIDVDPAGMAKWEEIQNAIPGLREAIQKSFTVRTPRGGYHFYFRGSGPTTASAIAPGIDTRGGYVDERTGKLKSIGYVVAPGSVTKAGPKTVDGEYSYVGGSIFDMPAPVLQIVPERKRGTTLGLAQPVTPDNPRNVSWAMDLIKSYVAEGRVSVEGAGGNDTAFRVAASILDKGVSPAKAYELLEEYWNPHCTPAWDDWELETIVGNAARYGEETGEGAKGFQDNASAFAAFAGTEAAPDDPTPLPLRKDRVQWIEDYASQVRDPVWLLPGFLPAYGTGMLYGASGSYKSFIALDMACCVAHGHAGQWGAPPVANDVVYFAGEAPIGTAKKRFPAWLEWQKPGSHGRLAIFPRVPYLGDKDGWEGVKLDIAELGIKPKLMIVDTMTRLLTGFDENSTKDANIATGFLEDLCRHYECFALAVHHTGKDETKGARGSSAFFANVDTVLATKKVNGGAALTVKKHKDADADGEPVYLKIKEHGTSIVLEKTDHLDEPATAGQSKIDWSTPQEILRHINDFKGRISHANLCQEIAGELGIDVQKVRKEIARRQDIQWLRSEPNWWSAPKTGNGLEYDL